NAGGPCRGDGKDATTNKICDSFPMYMKIDYIRLYQDTSESSSMAVGCDPATHPTAQWIADHIASYEDDDNKAIDVSGRAFCTTDDDCTISNNKTKVTTGSCVKSRCKCAGSSWSGPRCTNTLSTVSGSSTLKDSYGPPWYIALTVSGLTILISIVAVFATTRADQKREVMRKQQRVASQSMGSMSDMGAHPSKGNESYSTNFV
ncbi:Beta-glucan synthesis-associated protein, partial [Globisporangium polare]